jgi:TrmH family RNA methyltransferase
MGDMKKPLIASLNNPLVKQVRALRQKKARRESGLFLVEGIHHVGEVVEAGWEVENLLYAPDLLLSKFAHELMSRLPSPPQPVTQQVMESIADKEHPQGILAVVRQRRFRFDDLRAVRQAVALVSAQDPGNVGTILRTMDGVGADVLFLLEGGVDLYHPSLVRSSMGALFWKPVIQASFSEFVSWARARGFQLIGTSAHGDVEYDTLVPQLPWALVLGNEQKGLSREQMDACDVTVSLPMRGRCTSLNLSVAAGILLYQFAKSVDHENLA